jgi:hypothetical protein
MSKLDIKTKAVKIQQSIDNLENNFLEININGKDVNY